MLFFLMILISVSSLFSHDHAIKNIYASDQNAYPVIDSFNQGYVKVSEEHQIFFEEFGNPHGMPVLILHGGPGWGCSKSTTCFFDSTHYRVIMFDQRGCNRSLPFGLMKDNSPQDSVNDIEMVRTHLKIEKWIVFGGSYGSLLALLYGETHPERVYAFVLRGVFLGRKQDYENLFYGMSQFFPEAYKAVTDLVNSEDDIIKAMYERIMLQDRGVTQPLADAFMYYDFLCAVLIPHQYEHMLHAMDKDFALSVTRAYVHYSINKFFLTENQLLHNIAVIQDIPAFIVHGRYDLICPIKSAFDLYTKWEKSQLWIAEDAGHASTQKSISQSLKNIMDELKNMREERRCLGHLV